MKLIIFFSLFLCICIMAFIGVQGYFLQATRHTEVSLLTPSNEMVHQENEIRYENGLPPLQTTTDLNEFASERCATINASGNFSHDNWTKPFDTHHHLYTHYAENLAEKYANFDGAIEGWLNSPPHREQLLGHYQYTGSASCGIYIVQLFGN